MAAVPLRNQGETVGTMNVYDSDPRRPGPGGRELLQIRASHVGIALETSVGWNATAFGYASSAP